MKSLFLAGLISALFVGPVCAQSVKSSVATSSGVEVTLYSDEFASRHEYTAPAIRLADGFVLVTSIKRSGVATPVYLTGYFTYSGEWRRYASALFRGGDSAKFTSTGREVGRCSSSRYSRPSCTLSEGFRIDITPAEIKAHSQNGILAIQIRAEDTTTVILEVPVSYIEAVNEAVKR